MQTVTTSRKVSLQSNKIYASNFDQDLEFSITDDEVLNAKIIFKNGAHLSIELFSLYQLITTNHLKISFDARIAAGTAELWTALVETHRTWHAPVMLGELNEDWQYFVFSADDDKPDRMFIRFLKIFFRSDCDVQLKNITIHGLSGVESLHVVIPWQDQDLASATQQKRVLERLENQNLPFNLHVLELVYDQKPLRFRASKANEHHLVFKKDRRYAGINHKQALFDAFLHLHEIDNNAAYIFLDSEFCPQDKDWLEGIVEHLSKAAITQQHLLLCPFDKITTQAGGNTRYSKVHASPYRSSGHHIIKEPAFAMTGKSLSRLGFDDERWEPASLQKTLLHLTYDSALYHQQEMSQHVLQACLDYSQLQGKTLYLSDEEGFLYYPKLHGAYQQCMLRQMAHNTPEAVLADVLRTFDAPACEMQHITSTEHLALDLDSTNASDQQIVKENCLLQNMRLYTLGVEFSFVSPLNAEAKQHEFTLAPYVREAVSELATHPIILLTAPTVSLDPGVLGQAKQVLADKDIVFFTSKSTLPDVTAVAFSRAWWVENQVNVPHGLVFAGNYLNCLFQLLIEFQPDIPVLEDSNSVFHSGKETLPALLSHNEHVTEGVNYLHKNRFLSFKPFKRNRRKLRLADSNSATENALETEVLSLLDNDKGVYFDRSVNTSFLGKTTIAHSYTETWCGIIDGVFYPPHVLKGTTFDVQLLLENVNFQQSLTSCAGLFTYSQHLAKLISENPDWPSSVPIDILPRVRQKPSVGFRADWFWQHQDFKLYSIGYFARRLHGFFNLQSNEFTKLLITPSVQPQFQSYFDAERKLVNNLETVEVLDFYNRAAYEDILTKYPVFLDYYDLNASEVLVDCLVHNTPMIINRHPAAEELLGKNYPLFFTDLEEASTLLSVDTILAGHNYLGGLSKQPFFQKALLERLENSEIYRCL